MGEQSSAQFVERECADGCGRMVRLERTAGLPDKHWDWVSEMTPVCDQCYRKTVEQEVEEDRETQRQRRYEHRLAQAGLPAVRPRTWSDIDAEGRDAAIEAAKRWGKGEVNGLVLVGESGVGKTWVACAAALTRLRSERVRWYSVPMLIVHSQMWDSDERRETQVTLASTTPLVLDDIDKVKATEWVAQHLFLAIDHRVQNNGSFLITSNLQPDQFEEMYGPALSDRVFSGSSEIVELEGGSRR